MIAPLTREKVLHEIAQLKDRSDRAESRLSQAEGDPRFAKLSFLELRSAHHEVETEICLAMQLTCSNELDFRRVELALLHERDRLGAIEEALDGLETTHA